jgi:hypothetical protein
MARWLDVGRWWPHLTAGQALQRVPSRASVQHPSERSFITSLNFEGVGTVGRLAARSLQEEWEEFEISVAQRTIQCFLRESLDHEIDKLLRKLAHRLWTISATVSLGLQPAKGDETRQ